MRKVQPHHPHTAPNNILQHLQLLASRSNSGYNFTQLWVPFGARVIIEAVLVGHGDTRIGEVEGGAGARIGGGRRGGTDGGEGACLENGGAELGAKEFGDHHGLESRRPG